MQKLFIAVALVALPFALTGCVNENVAPKAEAVSQTRIEGETFEQAAERLTDEFPTIQTISMTNDPENEEFIIWTLDEDVVSGSDLNAKFGLPDDVKVSIHLEESPYKPSAG